MTAIVNPFDSLSWTDRMRIWQAGPQESRYTPQGYQEEFHRAMAPHIKAIGGGVGAAKSSTAVNDYCHEGIAALDRAAMGLGDGQGFYGRIAITGKTYDSPRVAFRYLKQRWDALGIVAECSDPESPRPWRMVSTTGVEVLTITAKDSEGMEFASRPYTVVHMTESDQQPIGMLNAALERVSRWPGAIPGKGKVYPEGTFERMGKAWFAERCKYWQIPGNANDAWFWNFPSWENGYVYPSLMVGDPRAGIPRNERIYQHYKQHRDLGQLEAWFAAAVGLGILNPEIEGLYKHYESIENLAEFWTKVGGVPPEQSAELWAKRFIPARHIDASIRFDPNLPVHFMFDPATHRYAGLWCQWTIDPHDGKDVCNFLDELVLYNADFHKYRARWLAHPATENVNLIVADVAVKRRDQGMKSTADWWAMPVDSGGCGHMPKSRWLAQDVGVQVMQTGLSDMYYKMRFSPNCKELFKDFRKERLSEQGEINEKLNVGVDDCRKAVSYYLALMRGTGMKRRAAAPARKAKGRYGAAPMSVGESTPQPRSWI